MEPSDLPPIDLMALGDMLGGDADLVTMILGKFRAEVHSDVMALQSLAIQNDPEPIRALAHRLKGTCGNAQATPLANSAKHLHTAMAAGNLDQAQNLIATLEVQRQEIERYLVQQGYGSEL
jgi:HPt (histidine-containing phosphotransfer) domain-containing protein